MPPPRPPSSASERRFFLAEAGPGGFRLRPEDEVHALRVLRLREGDRLVGLDGRGRAFPLEVTAAQRRELQVEAAGEPEVGSPAPGSGPGAPELEVWVSLPKAGRAEDMMGRLTQLGASVVQPILTARTPPHSAGDRSERLERVAREALKQSGRLWMPEVRPMAGLETLLGSASLLASGSAWLSPRARTGLSAWVDGQGPQASWRLVVGPEGGFEPTEEEALEAAGFAGVRISRAILRIETAAEGATAILGEQLGL